MLGTGPFAFIDRTLNLLVVERDPSDLAPLLRLLEPVTCFNVHTAASNLGALGHLRSGKRFHVCITDLGMRDVEDDEFHLLRHYGRHSSIIVLGGVASLRKGAECVALGARAVFDKGDSFDTVTFFMELQRLVLINLVNHRYNEWSADSINLATRTLFETEPESVTEWADNMRITDRQLRNIWHTNSGFGARHVLFLFQCFKHAFAYHESTLFGSPREKASAHRFFKQRFADYFEAHKELLTFMLS